MFDLTAEEARLLLNVALMATGANRFQSATKILAVLERFRPDHPSVAVATAILLISAQKFEEAVSFADAALEKFRNNAMLLAFKGMALLRLGCTLDANEVLLKAAEQNEDPVAGQLAKGLIS